MILFRPFKILKSALNSLAISEGQFIITTDTREMYVDIDATHRVFLGKAVDDIESKLTTVGSFSLATSAWEQNATTELYEAVILDNNVAATDLTDIAFDADSYDAAADAGVKPYTTEITGGIKLFADSVPESTLTGKYTINKGS